MKCIKILLAVLIVFVSTQHDELFSMTPNNDSKNEQSEAPALQQTNSDKEDTPASETICAICQEQIKTVSSATLACCGKSIHLKCLMKFALHVGNEKKSILSCPLCRAEMVAIPSREGTKTIVAVIVLKLGNLEPKNITLIIKAKKFIEPSNNRRTIVQHITARILHYLVDIKTPKNFSDTSDLASSSQNDDTQVFSLFFHFPLNEFSPEETSKIQLDALGTILELQFMLDVQRHENDTL